MFKIGQINFVFKNLCLFKTRFFKTGFRLVARFLPPKIIGRKIKRQTKKKIDVIRKVFLQEL